MRTAYRRNVPSLNAAALRRHYDEVHADVKLTMAKVLYMVYSSRQHSSMDATECELLVLVVQSFTRQWTSMKLSELRHASVT